LPTLYNGAGQAGCTVWSNLLGRLPDKFLLPGKESIHDPPAWLIEGVFLLPFFYFHDVTEIVLVTSCIHMMFSFPVCV
jgi:hypothetical protein